MYYTARQTGRKHGIIQAQMTHHNAANTTRPPSLVDTLGAGFRALNRSLPALLIPLALDLWYWLGPRISVRPLVDRLRAFDPVAWDQIRRQLTAALPPDRPFDLRLDGQFPFWRRIYTLVPAGSAPPPIEPATWHVGGILALLGAVIGINLLVTLLTAAYLVPLADVVRGSPGSGGWLRRVVRAWLAVLGIVGIVLAFLTVIGIPVLVVAGLLAQLIPALGYFVAAFFIVAVLWIVFTTSFAYDAVVVNNAGPFRAMLASVLVVRRWFWSAVGLFLLNSFILGGLGIIWERLAGSLPGLLLAMATSAYIGAGLAAAHLVFFRDRSPGPPQQPIDKT